MKTKKLYVLVNDCGDGSYTPVYTFSKEWIDRMAEKYDAGEICGPDDIGCDGDGFHYDVLTVPADATLKSLGINYDAAEDYPCDPVEEDEEE